MNAARASLPTATHRLRLITMSDQDRRDTPTDLAPPMSREEPTSPQASPGPMLPPNMHDSLFAEAVATIAGAARIIREGRDEQARLEALRRGDHDTLLAAIQRADDNGRRDYELLRAEMRRHRDAGEARDNGQDARIAAVEQLIGDVKEELLAALQRVTDSAAARIGALEDEITRLKAVSHPASA